MSEVNWFALLGCGWMGWMGMTMAQWCITPCSKVYSLASTFARSSKALRSSKVIPANNPFHSCKYSTGTSRTIWYGCNCYCQFKEGIQTYIIRLVCTVLRWIQYLQYLVPQPPVNNWFATWGQVKEECRKHKQPNQLINLQRMTYGYTFM